MSFMDRFMGGGRKNVTPAQSAKDRLKFVLVTDRTTLSPDELRKMQAEIIDVIRKYCRVNDDDVDLKFEQRERENYLVADIPLKPMRAGGEGGSIRLETSLTTASEDEDMIETKRGEKAAPLADAKTEELPAALSADSETNA